MGGWAGRGSLEAHPPRFSHPAQTLKVRKGTVWGKLLGVFSGPLGLLVYGAGVSGHAGGMGQLPIQLKRLKGTQVAYDSDSLSYH